MHRKSHIIVTAGFATIRGGPLFRSWLAVVGAFLCPIVVLLLTLNAVASERNTTETPHRPRPDVSFKPQEMADALHAVIAADREVYARYFDSQTPASNSPTNRPVPAHFLRQASESIQTKGAEFHYVLRSLWPINPKNTPATPAERAGLKFVLEKPASAYYAEESLGGRRYFTAVYADRAVVPSCAVCHNAHQQSPRKDFKTDDVMGGLIVRVPLEF